MPRVQLEAYFIALPQSSIVGIKVTDLRGIDIMRRSLMQRSQHASKFSAPRLSHNSGHYFAFTQ